MPSPKTPNTKSRSFKTHLGFLLGLIILMFISEGLYRFRFNKDLQIRLYLSVSHLLAHKSQIEYSLKLAEKAAEIRLSQAPDDAIQYDIPIKDRPQLQNSRIIKDYQELLENLNLDSLVQHNPGKWGALFYSMGLAAYKRGEPNLTIYFWQKAVLLAPEWSYFQVELANYYLSVNDLENAQKQLNFCLSFEFAKDHCNQYIQENLETKSPLSVGHWESDINGI